ncbi:MAG: lysophospholipid acyltransferase family protein [Sulfurospirillaceae bacterium]|nr:lysophospholipid acyltransferase family protein [Sulfurospirillaceae bacterium]MDD2826323.1 lysophospholipid acyltransferase family protein [Sulfurospirillaceae bacterium]
MREYLEYYIVKSILFLTKFLPISFIYTLCKTIASWFFKLDKRRRSLTLKNLHLAFPQKSESEILALAYKAYESVAITLAETLLMYHERLDIDTMIANKEEILARIDHYLANNNRGKLMITGHFSNWELLAHFFAKHGHPTKNIARRGNNHLIDENIILRFRQRYGNTHIYKKNAIISLVKTLKVGGMVSLLFDQKASGVNTIKTHFFGQEVDTIDIIAQLKRKFNPLVFPTFIARLPDGRYNVIMQDPVEYLAEETMEPAEQIIAMSQRYNDILEELIKQYPEQWFWMHNRWRLPQ